MSFFPCFTIIGDTSKLMEIFRITKMTFLHNVCRWASTFSYINMGMCFCLLYLIKIFKMAAELCKDVFFITGSIARQPLRMADQACNCRFFFISNKFNGLIFNMEYDI